MSFEFVWDTLDLFFDLLELFWEERDSSDEIAIFWSKWLWHVFGPWGEDSSFGVRCPKDDGELYVVNPAPTLVNPWLHGCEPRVP